MIAIIYKLFSCSRRPGAACRDHDDAILVGENSRHPDCPLSPRMTFFQTPFFFTLLTLLTILTLNTVLTLLTYITYNTNIAYTVADITNNTTVTCTTTTTHNTNLRY